MAFDIPEPALAPLFAAEVHVGPVIEIGAGPLGRRRVIPITGGRFDGPRLAGVVVPGGADWQIVTPDGTALLEARYTLKTHDGALIYINNTGVRRGPPDVLARLANGEDVDPTRYYFRTSPRFETGDARYAWLNTMVAIGSAKRDAGAVLLRFYEVT